MNIHFSLSKNSKPAFVSMLDDAGLEHLEIALASDTIMASSELIALAQTVVTSGAMASVLIAWIRSRASRKIIITTSDNKVVHAEGYSVEQLKDIMALAKRVDVIDTKPTDSNEHGTGT